MALESYADIILASPDNYDSDSDESNMDGTGGSLDVLDVFDDVRPPVTASSPDREDYYGYDFC